MILKPGDLAGLSITCPSTGVFNLTVQATATASNGAMANTGGAFSVTVTGPDITTFQVTGPSGTTSNFPAIGPEGGTYTLNAVAQETGQTLSYFWTVTGADGFLFTANTATPTFTAGEAGTYSVTLLVKDGLGQTAQDTGTINVFLVPPTIVKYGVPTNGTDGGVPLTAVATAPVGPVTYTWTITPPGGGSAFTLTGASVTLQPQVLGVFSVVLTVSDEEGQSTSTPASSITVTDNFVVGPSIVITDATGTNITGTTTSEVFNGANAVNWSITDPAAGVYQSAIQITQNGTPVSGSPFSTATGSFNLAALGVGTYVITISALDNDHDRPNDRDLSTATATITVLKANQTITWANPADITYGTALSGTQLDATVSGPGSAPTGAVTYTLGAGTILDAGNGQSLTVNVAATADYNAATATVSINVLKANQTITWANPADITYGTALGGTQLDASVTGTGPAATCTVTYTPAAGTILDAGNSQTLTVNVAATSDYNAATASVFINVLKANQTITWSNPADIVYGTALSSTQLDATVSGTGPAATGTVTYTPSAGTILDAGNGQTLTVNVAGTPDYNPATASAQINVLYAPLTITANNQSKVYGAALPALTVTYTGFVNGDNAANLTTPPTVTIVPADTHVGVYAITVSGAVDPNYTIQYQAGTLTITPAPLTITANDQTVPFGGPLPVLTYSVRGLVNGDTSANFTQPPTLSTTATASSPAGSYVITPAGLVDGDYAVTYVAGTLRIDPASLPLPTNSSGHVAGTTNAPVTSILTTGVSTANPVVGTANLSSFLTAPAVAVPQTAALTAVPSVDGRTLVTMLPLTASNGAGPGAVSPTTKIALGTNGSSFLSTPPLGFLVGKRPDVSSAFGDGPSVTGTGTEDAPPSTEKSPPPETPPVSPASTSFAPVPERAEGELAMLDALRAIGGKHTASMELWTEMTARDACFLASDGVAADSSDGLVYAFAGSLAAVYRERKPSRRPRAIGERCRS